MQLPVNLQELLKEAANIDAARTTPLSLSIYVDPSAPSDLIAHVRSVFASDQPTVRMTLDYLDERPASAHPSDDMAIVVAGNSEVVGPAALSVRSMGVPVMVCSTQPAQVDLIAAGVGAPIPDGDLISPQKAKRAPLAETIASIKRMLGREDTAAEVDQQSYARVAAIDIETAMKDPIALDDDAKAVLDDRMGRWIVNVCREKSLAFTLAFPFMRRSLAMEAVSETSIQNAGVGFLPLIPGADLPIMTANQAKMALQIAAAYGEPMGKERAKEIVAIVGGAFVCRTVARELIELVPVLGGVVRTGVGYFGTVAMGRAVIEYFEGGENVAGVTRVVERAADTATDYASMAQGAFERVRNFISNPVKSE